jgi:two-component system OmpR family response regulator
VLSDTGGSTALLGDPPARTGRVLVVDDEAPASGLLSATLRLVAYDVRVVTSGREALTAIDEFAPDLIVLDVELPDGDGLDVARRLRAAGRTTPVLVLSARDTVEDKVAGLAAGADDYVTKPFSIEEVVLRIRAILRRSRPGPIAPPAGGALRYADLELDSDAHEVRRAGRLVDLSPTEFNLLHYLLRNAGRVVSKAQILDRVWKYDFGGDGRIVESYVYYLRRKIDTVGPPLIHTVRGVGYTLRRPRVDSEAAPRFS